MLGGATKAASGCRFALCLVAAALLGAAVRHDRRPGDAAAKALVERLGVAGEAEAATARSVCQALEGAGPAGLAAGFELLGHPGARMRAGAAAYLGLARSHKAVPHLIPLLRDPDPRVREAVASALGAIADPEALPFLERAMACDDLAVAEAAMRAARHIRARELPPGDG